MNILWCLKTKEREVYLLKTNSYLNLIRRKRLKHQIEFDNKEKTMNESDFGASNDPSTLKDQSQIKRNILTHIPY